MKYEHAKFPIPEDMQDHLQEWYSIGQFWKFGSRPDYMTWIFLAESPPLKIKIHFLLLILETIKERITNKKSLQVIEYAWFFVKGEISLSDYKSFVLEYQGFSKTVMYNSLIARALNPDSVFDGIALVCYVVAMIDRRNPKTGKAIVSDLIRKMVEREEGTETCSHSFFNLSNEAIKRQLR